MENIEQIVDVGDVITEQITLSVNGELIDIKDFVLQTTVYEDIFSNIMSGALVLRDASNLINKYKFNGQEQVIVRFRSPGFSNDGVIEKTFYVSSVKGRTLGEKEQAYVLHLVSVEGAVDNVTKISKKFKGKTDVVISEVFEEYLKQQKELINQASHNTNIALLSTYWSPLKIINWICNRSFENAPNIVFYEGNKNFYLTSLEKLFQKQDYGTYSYIPTVNSGDWTLEDRYYFISEISDLDYYDIFRGQDFGYYASKLITHDITLKQYKEFQHDHYQYRDSVESLDEYTIFPSNLPKNADSFRVVRTKQYGMFPEKEDPQYEVWAMKRNSLMYEANNFKMTIAVPGKTDIEVGTPISVLLPKSIAKDSEVASSNLFDPYLSGRYLITGIRHQFTLNKHQMFLEIMKESFQLSTE